MNFRRGEPPPRPQIKGYEHTHSVPGNMIPDSKYIVQGPFAIDDTGGDTGGLAQRGLSIGMDTDNSSTGHHAMPSTSGRPEPRTPPGPDLPAALPEAPQFETDGQHGMAPSDGTPRAEDGMTDYDSTFGDQAGMTLITPRGGNLEISADNRVNTVFLRGQPDQSLATPYPAGAAGPGGFTGPTGPAGATQGPTMPGNFKEPHAPGMPSMPPPPPPPPKEDEQSFVRRIRLTYMDKVIKEHERFDLAEDHSETGKDTPPWVYTSMTMMPYLATCTFAVSSVFTILAYGVKFQDNQAERWILGSMIGVGLILSFLELFRVAMMTLVELRKFENRKKAKAGHFLPRRIKRGDADKNFQEMPKPKLWNRSVAAPRVPEGHVNKKLAPSIKPSFDLPGMPGNAKYGLPPLAPRSDGHSGLPVIPPPPPPAKSGPAQRDFSGAFGQGFSNSLGNIEPLERGYDRGPHTPTSVMSGRSGPLGATPGPGAGLPSMERLTTPDQTLDRSGTGLGSLGALRQEHQKSLSEQVRAGTDRATKPPPPPGSAQGSQTGTPRSAGSGPSPPKTGPPAYSRRPTSGGTAGSR